MLTVHESDCTENPTVHFSHDFKIQPRSSFRSFFRNCVSLPYVDAAKTYIGWSTEAHRSGFSVTHRRCKKPFWAWLHFGSSVMGFMTYMVANQRCMPLFYTNSSTFSENCNYLFKKNGYFSRLKFHGTNYIQNYLVKMTFTEKQEEIMIKQFMKNEKMAAHIDSIYARRIV